jgi:hypothetical protein
MLARLGLELQVEAREGCVPRAAARQVVEVDKESEVPAPVVVQQGSVGLEPPAPVVVQQGMARPRRTLYRGGGGGGNLPGGTGGASCPAPAVRTARKRRRLVGVARAAHSAAHSAVALGRACLVRFSVCV